MKTTQLVLAGVLGLALLGGGFAAGMTVGRSGGSGAAASPSPSGVVGRFGQGGAGLAGRGALGGPGAAGQTITTGRVLSVNDGSITVEVRQAGAQGASPTVTSQIVLVGTTTRIVKTTETEIKAADLKANDQVQIVGTADTSGSVAATTILVGGETFRQMLGGGQGAGPGGRGATPSPSPTR